MLPTPAGAILPRADSTAPAYSDTPTSGGGSTNEFLSLISNPFNQQFASSSFLSAIIFSLVLTAILSLAFCFIRPYNSVVYAPRAKHADSKHAPPPVDGGIFGWINTMRKTKEPDLVEKVGLDGAVFMRFTRMMRNMFTVLTIVGCGVLIPTNLTAGKGGSFFTALTPESIGYGSSVFWVYVVLAYAFDVIIFYFLWSNYRHILQLRRTYLDSKEYQRSLHSRTLLLTDIPQDLRTDEGIVRLTGEVKGSTETPRAAIARNMKDLPELVEEHEKSVRQLEKHLAKYLQNPNKLPAKRPTCKVSENDKAYTKGQEVDAIEYLTARIKTLEVEIKEMRLHVDNRNPMSYGFATYGWIADAHNEAYMARKGGPEGTIIKLAPKPQHLIWKNLGMTKKDRSWQNFINNLWVALLTIAWIAPNVLIAVFLSNLSHLGLVWPAFRRSLYAHPIWWAIVQGVVSPAITTAFYFFLPAIFRRLVTKAGDVTKTGRERHVMHKLFSFFMFNNLIVFSLFSAVWTYIAAIVNSTNGGEGAWAAIKGSHPFRTIVSALITVSPYWCSWLLQRNLGAAIDLSQLVRLTWGSFSRRFLSPTPRELIELTAPQPFEYASYYNYFLFYAAVALCFGVLQPLTLAITALYFWFDSFSKKYMILYIFITKYESGGMFWRTLFNRVLISVGLGNIVIALLVVAYGNSWFMLAAMAPLAVCIGGFKWYCARTFDSGIQYYTQGKTPPDAESLAGDEPKGRKGEKVGVRFGHPVLYQALLTPMVSAKSQHMLKQVYTGRTSVDEMERAAGYSDMYMESMDNNKPGKSSGAAAPFEIVGEHQMDYEHWKDKAEFRSEGGGDGELFGQAPDMVRPGTPGSMVSGAPRTGTWESERSRSQSREDGVEYPRGYHPTPSGLREQSPSADRRFARKEVRPQQSREGLVGNAAGMGQSPPPQLPPMPAPGTYRPIQMGLGVETPGSGTASPYETNDADTSYDYFRRGRNR